ncbi:MAG TPA: crosslink repair DNA glycosylase YcaQ family protein [Pseudonocardia sp.]|nr:crosslink repair DNA glycosylase YcaQ family protein [Pseudonocardia sp.]
MPPVLPPATPADVAGFLGTTATAVRPHLPADLVPVEVDGRAALCPPDQVEALTSAGPPPGGVRLLGPSDPYLQGRDGEVLVPDRARRCAVWRWLGPPGVVVAGGEVAGTWPTRQKGSALEITIEPFPPRTVRRSTSGSRASRPDARGGACADAGPVRRALHSADVPSSGFCSRGDRDPWSSRALRTSRRAGLQ